MLIDFQMYVCEFKKEQFKIDLELDTVVIKGSKSVLLSLAIVNSDD